MKTLLIFLLTTCTALAQTALQRAIVPKSPADIGAAPASLTASTPTSATLLYDNFNRANVTGGLGTAPDGLPYDMTGAALATSGIQNNRYFGTGVVYASKLFTTTPTRIAGVFSFTNTGFTVALISSADVSLALNKMIHLTVSQSTWALTKWNGASQQQVLASGIYVNTAALSVSTSYKVAMSINGNQVFLELPDGSTASFYDTDVPLLSGNRAIWEHTTAGSYWESVSAEAASVLRISSKMYFRGGIDGTPIGLTEPAFLGGNHLYITTDRTKAWSSNAIAEIRNEDGSGNYAGLRIASTKAGGILEVANESAGYSPIIRLSNNGIIYKFYSTSAADLRIAVNNTDVLTWPYSGNAVSARGFTAPLFAGTGTKPTIAAGAGAGTSPTVSVVRGTQFSHQVSIVTGTSPTASSVIATITIPTAYSSSNFNIQATPNNQAAAGVLASVYYQGASTTTYTLTGTLAASTTYVWNVLTTDQ